MDGCCALKIIIQKQKKKYRNIPRAVKLSDILLLQIYEGSVGGWKRFTQPLKFYWLIHMNRYWDGSRDARLSKFLAACTDPNIFEIILNVKHQTNSINHMFIAYFI